MTQPPRSGLGRGLGRGLGALIPTGPSLLPSPPSAPLRLVEEGHSDAQETEPAGTGSRDAGGGSPDGTPGSTDAEGSPDGGTGSFADSLTDVPGAPAASGAYFAELDLASLRPNPRQPRQVFDEDALAELVASIREVGLLQPVVARRLGPDSYELVMGERRWRAAQAAGLTNIPVIVRETAEGDLLRDALLENLQRADLNPLEEAAAYEQLLDDFGCTHEQLAARLGRSRPQISNTIRLLKLAPPVQRRLAAGVLSAGHARSLLAVPDTEVQERLASRVVAEGISVRGLEELVAAGEGAGGGGTRRRAKSQPVHGDLADVASRLADRLDTRVRVTAGSTRGRIIIDFATVGDLQRIAGLIDP